MKVLSIILVSCFVVGAFAFIGVGLAAQEKPAAAKALDPAKPDTWEASVNDARRELGKIAKALIAVAKDEGRSNDDRRKAIFLLGKMGNKESIDFLIANVSLRIPMVFRLTEEAQAKETPCMYVLQKARNWNVAKAILESLKVQRPQLDLAYLSLALDRILTRRVAIAAVEQRSLQTRNRIWKENLATLKTFLSQ
ncbi:MAG: hypothetical protein QGD94_05765 [Planctomycetia bacterium]|nr:hypothetical protein [Planctomycetia bacterium]